MLELIFFAFMAYIVYDVIQQYEDNKKSHK